MSDQIVTPRMSVDLFQKHVTARLSSGVSKDISYVDFLEFIRKFTGEVSNEALVEGIKLRLPHACIDIRLGAKDAKVLMYYPEASHTLYFRDSEIPNCRLPNLAIVMDLNMSSSSGRDADTWYVSGSKWYTMPHNCDPDGLSLDNVQDLKLGSLSLPNMYEDGRMCTGDNSVPPIPKNDFRPLNLAYVDVLLRGRFNNDLSIPNLRDSCSPRDMLSFLQDLPYYPYDILYKNGGFVGPVPYNSSRSSYKRAIMAYVSDKKK